jgi:hypothetical protein
MSPRRRRKRRNEQRGTIDALDAPESKRLLGALLDTRPDLMEEVAGLASRELGGVSVEGVAAEIARVVGRLRIEDVWDRAGRRSDGSFVEETEAAWGVVEDAAEPFVLDIERSIRLGRAEEALAVCQGALLGLYRVEQEQADQFLGGYAPDAIGDVAWWVADTWKKSGGRAKPLRASDRAAMRTFVSQTLPGWERFLVPVVGKGRRRRERS